MNIPGMYTAAAYPVISKAAIIDRHCPFTLPEARRWYVREEHKPQLIDET
jgi:hypothetical protein